MSDPGDDERQLRIDLMEMRNENRKFLVQLVLAISAAVAVGIAIGRFVLFHA